MADIAPADVVAAARGCLGWPYQHQGRSKAGIDCIGLVIVVAKALSLAGYDDASEAARQFNVYGPSPNPNRMRRALAHWLRPLPVEDAAPGDVLWLAWGDQPQHVAIRSALWGEPAMIHAYSRNAVVVEHLIDLPWQRKIREAWRFPEFC